MLLTPPSIIECYFILEGEESKYGTNNDQIKTEPIEYTTSKMDDFSTDDDDEKLVIKEEIDIKEEPISQYDNNLSQVKNKFLLSGLA